jgi:hypothetical protein
MKYLLHRTKMAVCGSQNVSGNKNTSLKFLQQFWDCHELRRPE